jgi:tetratricopeptide (TPR) repeat protein
MDDEGSLRFLTPGLPKMKDITPNEAEMLLQSRLKETQDHFEDAIWELIGFYSSTGRQDLSRRYLFLLMELTEDPEKRALYWLTLGQIMEEIQDFEKAIDCYKQGYRMEPTSSWVGYFLNNNLGYSMVQIGLFEEAEPYLRAAIEIDPKRHNAYKNLGLSLQGQRKYSEAVNFYLESIRTNPFDPRALKHLEALVDEHPELTTQVPHLIEQFEVSREAVNLATQSLENLRKRQMEDSFDFSKAEKILIAVARLVFSEGKSTFSSEDVRRNLDLPPEEWMAGYRSIFQGMEGAPYVKREYKKLFYEVRHGIYSLTEDGHDLISKLQKM